MPTVPAPPATPRARTRRPAGRTRRMLTCSAAVLVSLAASLLTMPAASAATPMYLGAVGQVQELSRQTGQPLAVHAYAHFHNNVPNGRMITVRSSATWRQVASAQPGTAVHNDIVRWAQTIKGRPGPIMLAYHHEPEASGSTRYGTAPDFIAAYRKVVGIFRAQGVRNVQYVWQMTDWAFRTGTGDARHANRWYPGDAYVDNVGADVFNWSNCRDSRKPWVELGAVTGPVFDFARAHGKQASLPEFGADADPRRAQWLKNAHTYFVANRDVLSAVFYFNHPPTRNDHSACSWNLTTSAEHKAFGDMARNRTYFRS